MHTIFVLDSDVSDERTFYFVFDCYVSDKHTLYLYFIVTLVMSALSVLYLFCYVRDKRTLYLYFIVTLVISALSLLCLIVTLRNNQIQSTACAYQYRHYKVQLLGLLSVT